MIEIAHARACCSSRPTIRGVNPALIVAAGVAAYHDTKFRELEPFDDVVPFLEFAREAGLRCIGQEIVNWKTGSGRLIDCLSLFTREGAVWERPNRVIRNGGFMGEAAYLSKLSRLYGNGFPE